MLCLSEVNSEVSISTQKLAPMFHVTLQALSTAALGGKQLETPKMTQICAETNVTWPHSCTKRPGKGETVQEWLTLGEKLSAKNKEIN